MPARVDYGTVWEYLLKYNPDPMETTKDYFPSTAEDEAWVNRWDAIVGEAGWTPAEFEAACVVHGDMHE